MPAFPSGVKLSYYLITFGITLVGVSLLTWFSGMKTVRNKPAVLLTPKAPKSGKKVLIERIPFIWKRLSFKYKSTIFAENVIIWLDKL